MKFQNIQDVINILSESNEEMLTLEYENILVRVFAVPALLLGSILNFVVIYLILQQHTKITLANTFFLLIFALTLEFFSRIIKNEKFKAHFQSALLSAVLCFVVLRFYYLIGPAVWTTSIILVVISMARTKVSMLSIFSLTIFLLGMYVWYMDYPFHIGTLYYISQTISFTILFCITAAVYTIITNRYKKIYEQYKYILTSENKINNLIDMEEKITKLAYYDYLTGLPNRRLFNDKLSHCIIDIGLSKKTLGVLFLDLDSFKRINDTMGHSKGDELLKMVSSRLTNILGKGDIWQDAGILNVPIAVNLSVNQFQNTKIVEQITKILGDTQLNPNDLELEITENNYERNRIYH